jgi:hypothetical protein
MRRRALWLLTAVGLPAQAYAEPSPHERAEALFREGRTATQAGDYKTACTKFGESQRLDPSTGTLFNLGDCSEHLGRLLAARNYFQDAIAQIGDSDPRIAPARQRLEALEKRLPRLTIALAAGAPHGSNVQRDGRAVPDAELGAAVPLDPGEHTVIAAAPGWRESRVVIVLHEAESRQVAVKPEPESAPTPAPQAPRSSPYLVGWIVGGVGALGLALAGVSGLVLMSEKSTADSGCTNKTNCSPAAESAISANKSWLVVNTAAWIVGAVGVGAGAFLILTHRDAQPAARVGVASMPGGAGVSGVLELD